MSIKHTSCCVHARPSPRNWKPRCTRSKCDKNYMKKTTQFWRQSRNCLKAFEKNCDGTKSYEINGGDSFSKVLVGITSHRDRTQLLDGSALSKLQSRLIMRPIFATSPTKAVSAVRVILPTVIRISNELKRVFSTNRSQLSIMSS